MKKFLLSAFALVFAMAVNAAIEKGDASNANPEISGTAFETAATVTFCEGNIVTWRGGSSLWQSTGTGSYSITIKNSNESSDEETTEFSLSNGATGKSSNPVMSTIDGTSISQGLPTSGTYYEFAVAEGYNGYLYIIAKTNTKKNYIAFEGETRIPYYWAGYDENVGKVVSFDLSEEEEALNSDDNNYIADSYKIDSIGAYFDEQNIEHEENTDEQESLFRIKVTGGKTYTFCGTGTNAAVYGYCFAPEGETITFTYIYTDSDSGNTTEHTLIENETVPKSEVVYTVAPTAAYETVLENISHQASGSNLSDILEELYVETNAPEGSSVKWTITNTDTNESAGSGDFTYDSDGVYYYENAESETLLEGNTYTLTVTVYDENEEVLCSADILTITGTGTKTSYSDVNVEFSYEGNVYTLTFDAEDVEIESASYKLGMWGSDVDFEESEISTSSSNGKTICTLTLDEETYNETASEGGAAVFLTITAKDSQGLYLNDDYEDGSLHFTATIEFVPDWSFDPESGSTVEKLDSITVTCESGIAISYYGDISITKDDEILTGISIECEEVVDPDDQWATSTSCTIKFIDDASGNYTTLTDAGTYVITIEDDYFYLGEELEDYSPEVVLTYTISSNSDSNGDSTAINGVSLQSAGNNVFYNLNGQRVSAPTHGIYILNGKKVLVK